MSNIPPTFGNLPHQRVPFGDRLSGLCSIELTQAHGDPDRIAGMIERLLNSLAFTIAIAARGNPKAMDEMLKGAEAYLYEAAAGHQKIGQFMAEATPPQDRTG